MVAANVEPANWPRHDGHQAAWDCRVFGAPRGRPFHPLNAADATALCALVRNRFGWDGERTIWAWTGYTFDELLGREHARMLLPMLDVLVDGPFILGERDLNLPFMGSRNQRVVDVQATLAGRRDGSLGVGEVVVLDEWMRAPEPPTVDA